MKNTKVDTEIVIDNFFDSVIFILKKSKTKVDNTEWPRINANIILVRNLKRTPNYVSTYSNLKNGCETSITSTGFNQFDPNLNSLFLAFTNVVSKMCDYYYKNKTTSSEKNLLNAITTWNNIRKELHLPESMLEKNTYKQKSLKEFLNISKFKNLFFTSQPELTY